MPGKVLVGWIAIFWALWLGGLGALFLFVSRLFAVDRALAIKTAPHLFVAFEKYQLLLAALALLATVGWRILAGGGAVTALFWLFAAAAALAAIGPMLVTHRMMQLWAAGQSATPEFARLHGISMIFYSSETLILLAAGFVLPWAIGLGGRRGGGPAISAQASS